MVIVQFVMDTFTRGYTGYKSKSSNASETASNQPTVDCEAVPAAGALRTLSHRFSSWLMGKVDLHNDLEKKL